MRYELSAEAEYVLAKVYDRRTAEDVIVFYQAVADECARSGLDRVLVESHETEVPPLLGLRDCAEKLQHLFRGRRVAGFYADAGVFSLAADFAQFITNSRGITNRMFNDRDAALDWLLEHVAPGPGSTR
jgi:hypothetical protein